MSHYPWREKNKTFTWLNSLYNRFNKVDLFMNILPSNELPQSKISFAQLVGGISAFL